MPLVPTQLDKRSTWERLYAWDFSGLEEFTDLGQTIDTATLSFVTADNGEGNDGQLVVGAGSTSGFVVSALVSGGTPGRRYQARCSVVTSPDGYEIDLDGVFNVF